MSEISNKDSEQDVKIAVIDSTLENATRRMELIHKRIDRTDERITKLNEDVRERIRALEKWVWGAGAVLTAFIVIGGVVGDLNLLPDNDVNTVHTK
jgi:DNA-binding ferritin-like protein (Dps family)